MELIETKKNTQKEITPLSMEDLFIVLDRPDAKFDYPSHYHSDFEINLVINSKGKRIIGDSIEDFGKLDLVMVGPDLPHVWKGEIETGNHVVTIQFHSSLLDYPILSKRLFNSIRELLQRSSRGIKFSSETSQIIKDKILRLTKVQGFDTVLDFFSILYELSVSPGQVVLADNHFAPDELSKQTKSRRITKVCNYVDHNYKNAITLSEISKLVGMSESAFSHFFKKQTRHTFIDYVNDIRIGYATQMLFETSHSISEVCYNCGFNSMPNFIRVFKRRKGQTPSEYRIHIKNTLIKF